MNSNSVRRYPKKSILLISKPVLQKISLNIMIIFKILSVKIGGNLFTLLLQKCIPSILGPQSPKYLL